QFLRRNRRPSELGVQLVEFPRQCTQRLVHNLLDRSQGMIQWHPRFAAQIAEQRLTPDISTAHRTLPHISSRSAYNTPYLAPKCHFFRILLAPGFTASRPSRRMEPRNNAVEPVSCRRENVATGSGF